MKRSIALLSAVFVLISVSCVNRTHDQRFESLDNFLSLQAEYYSFNGNILVAEKGKTVYQKSFGFADYDNKIPLNDSTIFELASVSKQFTAMGILMLEEKGKLGLNDSLRKFFPELPYANITLHQMLTHTSGLPDYMDLLTEKWDHQNVAHNSDVIALMAQEKPVVHFQPGEKWEYSNTAYVLLASIIEQVSGLTFRGYVHENIFAPLGMNRTRVYNTRRSGEIIDNYAYGHVWSDSLSRYIIPDSLPHYGFLYFLDGIQGDGIINSTTGDLLKWNRFLADNASKPGTPAGKLVQPYERCDTALSTMDSRWNGTSILRYGYGMFTGENEFGGFFYHSGGWPGYLTDIFHDKTNDIDIIALSNNQSLPSPVRGAIQKIMLNRPVELPEKYTATTLDSAALDVFTGTYSLLNQEYKIIREGNNLYIINPVTKRRTKLSPESDHKLFNPNSNLQFEISQADGGQSKFYQIVYGSRFEMQKIK